MSLLDGIKVIDMSNLLPGPFTTQILADLGAEVIKVERPGGDPVKQMIPGLYESLNGKKQTIILNLKTEEDRVVLRDLLSESDVLVEGFRPGVMDRLGFGKEEAGRLNPDLIYCSISGYGQEGPYSTHPGHDLNYLAVAGALSISGSPTDVPEAGGGIQVADLASSLYAAISILAALAGRSNARTGGTYIDISMVESVLSLMGPRIAEYYARQEPDKEEFMSRGAYGAYRTKDGKYIALGLVEEKFWEAFCEIAGMREFLLDGLFNSWTKRMENAEVINRRVDQIIAQKSQEEWLELLRKEDIPVSPVNEIKDLLNDRHLKHRQAISGTPGNINIPFPGKMEPIQTPDRALTEK